MNIDIKKISQSKRFIVTISVIVSIAVLTGIFQAGIFVGFHKASFLYKSGDNFYRAFGNRDDRGPMGQDIIGGIFKDEMSGGHGVVGKIIKVNLPNIVVMGPDNIEKVVLIDEKTNVHEKRNVSSTNELRVDQYISVLGTPNDNGQIVAKFIRIVPPPPKELMSRSIINNAISTTTTIK